MEYAALIYAAWLNRADMRGLILTLAVGLSVCAPLNPDWFNSAVAWYYTIIMAELCVFVVAVWANRPESNSVALVCLSLAAWHMFEYKTDPYEGGLSLYSFMVPILELSQLLFIILTKIKHISGGYNGNVAAR